MIVALPLANTWGVLRKPSMITLCAETGLSDAAYDVEFQILTLQSFCDLMAMHLNM